MSFQPQSQKHILLVEDNDEMRQALAQTLTLENYIVYEAAHGQAALVLLQRMTPDLIVSDIQMPRMDGIELYKTIRRNPSWVTIPFIFLTAADTPEAARMGRELGVEDYLTKPVESTEFLAIVNARLLRMAELQVAQVGQAYADTVLLLANTIEGRDANTHGHVERVARYARHLAEALGWAPEHLRKLEFGARLHDIGKIIVPDHILNKEGQLTPDEWEIMRQHPMAGTRIVQGISHLQDTLPYILCHHERWDGTGYPHGLRGKDIPIEGRLLAVVDVYDALTTVRPYHPARSKDDVIKFLTVNAGRLFDPHLTAVFLHLLKTQVIK